MYDPYSDLYVYPGHSHVIKDTPKPKDKDRDNYRSVGGVRKFVQVSCSTHHCCALDTNAHAHCWGYGLSFGEMLPPTKKNMTMIGVVGDGGEDPAVTELLDLDEDEDEEDEEDEDEEDSETENFDITDAQEILMLERLQFKQISVGEAYSCGIVMHEDKASEEVIFSVFIF
jgi:alpha-tubulin suppressor-like RCC1 family protein